MGDELAGLPAHTEAGRGSASAPGEGIGLSIVKRLCDLLDATVELETETGVGTAFRILLPRRYGA
jgi:signal transduction histidine kinase